MLRSPLGSVVIPYANQWVPPSGRSSSRGQLLGLFGPSHCCRLVMKVAALVAPAFARCCPFTLRLAAIFNKSWLDVRKAKLSGLLGRRLCRCFAGAWGIYVYCCEGAFICLPGTRVSLLLDFFIWCVTLDVSCPPYPVAFLACRMSWFSEFTRIFFTPMPLNDPVCF